MRQSFTARRLHSSGVLRFLPMIRAMGEDGLAMGEQSAWWSWLLGTWAKTDVQIHSPLPPEASIGRIQAISTNTRWVFPFGRSASTDVLLFGIVQPSGRIWVTAFTTYQNGFRPRFRGAIGQTPAGSEISGQVGVTLFARAFAAFILLFLSFITLVLLAAGQWLGVAVTAGFLAFFCVYVGGARYAARREPAAITEALRSAVDGQGIK